MWPCLISDFFKMENVLTFAYSRVILQICYVCKACMRFCFQIRIPSWRFRTPNLRTKTILCNIRVTCRQPHLQEVLARSGIFSEHWESIFFVLICLPTQGRASLCGGKRVEQRCLQNNNKFINEKKNPMTLGGGYL